MTDESDRLLQNIQLSREAKEVIDGNSRRIIKFIDGINDLIQKHRVTTLEGAAVFGELLDHAAKSYKENNNDS